MIRRLNGSNGSTGHGEGEPAALGSRLKTI
jgi:hypothetical protein